MLKTVSSAIVYRGAADLMEHWQEYAEPALAGALEKYQGGLAHDYDWRLNGSDSRR
jgi:hypothetical protein